MTAAKRKVVQIAYDVCGRLSDGGGDIESYARYLCNDGTIWVRNYEGEWIELTDLPPGCLTAAEIEKEGDGERS